MKIYRSVASNLFFPATRRNAGDFRTAAGFLHDLGVQCMEYYHDGEDRDRIGEILSSNGMGGVYIAVIPLKEQFRHLCDTDENGRREAVALSVRCMDEAAGNGVGTVMFNSGRIIQGYIDDGMNALVRSFGELYEYREKMGYKLRFELEPCDSGMDARQLIGPYRRTAVLAKRMHSAGLPLMLTMDSAHTAEEGEDFFDALSALKPFCSHVHFANCQIRDSNDVLYGDKHLGYEYSGTEWTFEAINSFIPKLESLYPGRETLQIGLEVLCREENPYTYFQNTWDRLPFMSAQRGETA